MCLRASFLSANPRPPLPAAPPWCIDSSARSSKSAPGVVSSKGISPVSTPISALAVIGSKAISPVRTSISAVGEAYSKAISPVSTSISGWSGIVLKQGSVVSTSGKSAVASKPSYFSVSTSKSARSVIVSKSEAPGIDFESGLQQSVVSVFAGKRGVKQNTAIAPIPGNRRIFTPLAGKSEKHFQLKGESTLQRLVGIRKSRSRISRISLAARSSIEGSVSMPASGWTYPLRGLLFFCRKGNQSILWRRVGSFAAEVGVSSVAILGAITGLTFHYQRKLLLSVLPRHVCTAGTIALILVETAVPVALLFYQRLHRVQEKLFVDVMNLRNVTVQRASPDELGWIADQRLVQQRKENLVQVSRTRRLVTSLTDPENLSTHPITKYFLTLPLNFIPVAGQVMFCWLNSLEVAAALHHHYYSHLKKLSPEDEATMIHVRKDQYEQFGLVASALTLIPGLNVILVLTNAVGAALWAADLEKELHKNL